MSNKEALIADAQKMMEKGQLDKAIKGYQQALAIDPGDLRIRQRVGELLARINRKSEARIELEAVGKTLASGGFYLKAIAVYKQIERLFPEDTGVILIIAELNEKHGLIPNAIAEYKRAYERFEKASDFEEGVKVLALMQKADPQNINLKLKYAEVLHQIGYLDSSKQAFHALAGLLLDRKEFASFVKLVARIFQIFGSQDDFVAGVIREKIANAAETALHALQNLLKSDSRSICGWRLVIEVYSSLGQAEKVKMACRHLLQFSPDDLIAQEYLVRTLIQEDDLDEALSFLEQHKQNFFSQRAVKVFKELCLELHEKKPFGTDFLTAVLKECLAAEADEASSEQSLVPESPVLPAATFSSDDYHDDEESFPALPVWDDEYPLPVKAVSSLERDEAVSGSELQTSMPEAGPEETGVALDEELFEIDVDFDDVEAGDPTSSGATTNENWFESVTGILDTVSTGSAVKFGDELDNTDYQSHFDLGLAFREMGLFDDAISEFRQASADPDRRLKSLAMQGACLRDKGELELAENVLRALLGTPGQSTDEEATISYELALTLRHTGKEDEAREMLESLEISYPGFRDVAALLRDSSSEELLNGLDFSEDELSGFDLK